MADYIEGSSALRKRADLFLYIVFLWLESVIENGAAEASVWAYGLRRGWVGR